MKFYSKTDDSARIKKKNSYIPLSLNYTKEKIQAFQETPWESSKLRKKEMNR